MMLCILVLVSVCIAAPLNFQSQNPSDDIFLGYAWDAAAGSVNEGRDGKYLVPKEIKSAKVAEDGSGKSSQIEVLYQESWCSPEDGNDISDVCESMCPLYYGGKQAIYIVTVNEDASGNSQTVAEKVRDIEN